MVSASSILDAYEGVRLNLPDLPALIVNDVRAEMSRLASIEHAYNALVKEHENDDLYGYKLFDGDLQALTPGTVLLANGSIERTGKPYQRCMVTVFQVRRDDPFGFHNIGYVWITDHRGVPTLEAAKKVGKNAQILLAGTDA
jgi:hypothetical protein